MTTDRSPRNFNLGTAVLPITAVGAVLVAVVAGVLFLTELSTRVTILESNQSGIQVVLKDFSVEFKELSKNVNRLLTLREADSQAVGSTSR